MTSRAVNWEEVWSSFMMGARKTPFVWGESDCMIFAGENVLILTGVDLVSSHKGKYSTEREAIAYLKKAGYDRPVDMVASHLEEVSVSMAQRGDLVMYQGNLGVCMAGLSLFKGEKETELVRTLDCSRAWKVGS